MYQSFIGLEVHIHLLTKSKVFCSCKAAFGDEPNTNVCPVCMGYPGVLPALNAEAMRMSAVVAKALNCTVSPKTWFERKQYFYPDMPKNYQISQFASPVGVDGHVELEFHRKKKQIRIKECHLEEDAGKMVHAGNVSLLDYNRAGTSLLEIVTEPDFEIGEEAELFLQQLRRTVRYLGVCDGNMEEGSLRCDANVSVNLRGAGLGRKVEIKNLNSSRFVRLGLNYEIKRQTEILEKGGTVKQETRLWNENRDQTESMRSKESAHDYRFFPEPDLLPFYPDAAFLKTVDTSLVELPAAREKRLGGEYGLTEAQAAYICEEKALADYFEAAVQLAAADRSMTIPDAAERVAAWISSDVKRIMNRDGLAVQDIGSLVLSPARLASLVRLIATGRISGKIAKQVLEAVFSEEKEPEAIVSERGWEQITDPVVVVAAVDRVFAQEPGAVSAAGAGDAKLFAYLVGKILAATEGRAEPSLARRLLEARFSTRRVDLLSFGGAIAGKSEGDLVIPGELGDLKSAFAADPELGAGVQVEPEALGSFLSEEISPSEWSLLVSALAKRNSTSGPDLPKGNPTGGIPSASGPSSTGAKGGGSGRGVVVAHGTDTLPYTAPLVHWLFGRADFPVILAASSAAPANARKAAELLKPAILRALSDERGVGVFVDSTAFPAVNLKFERVANAGFGVWNASSLPDLPKPFDTQACLSELDEDAIRCRIEDATRSLIVLKIFPGMRADLFAPLMSAGYTNFILELYDTGTAPSGDSPYSLREAIRSGRERGASFYCTSQQEGVVDFSLYLSAHELWKVGAVPMGALTTESSYARFVAAWIVAGDQEGARSLMEVDHASIG